MSIEKLIEANTAALVALTEAIGKMQAPGEVVPEKKPVDVPEQKAKPAQTVTEKEEPSKNTSTTSEDSSKESAAVTYDEVKRAILEVSKKSRANPQDSREQAEALLARFGVQKISQLAVSQYSDALKYAEEVMGGKDATAAE